MHGVPQAGVPLACHGAGPLAVRLAHGLLLRLCPGQAKPRKHLLGMTIISMHDVPQRVQVHTSLDKLHTSHDMRNSTYKAG